MKTHTIFQVALALFFAIITFGRINAQNEKTLLWEIKGPGLTKPSYLYGTIHLMCPDQLKVSEVIKTTLKKTDQLYLELDMDDPQTMPQMQSSLALPAGKTLRDYCSATDYQMIDSFFRQQLGTPLEPLNGFKPLLALQMIYIPMLGCQPDSWESRLMAIAAEQKKEVLGLETIQMQMGVFDSIPYTEQMGWLKLYTGDMAKAKADFESMVKTYVEQDIEKLSSLIRETPEFKKYAPLLLDNRNKNWAVQIPAIARQKSTFFAVGSGHLGGEKGVIAMLRAKGYTVTGISTK